MNTATDLLGELVRLAERCRVARVRYQKPGEVDGTERMVEAYQLVHSADNLIVHCYQLSPPTAGNAWRCFRVDRFASVEDGGMDFAPRRPVRLSTGEVREFCDVFNRDIQVPETGLAAYQPLIEKLAMARTLGPSDIRAAREIGRTIGDDQLRAAHARAFAAVLSEMLIDGEVSEREMQYLAEVRTVLADLGWAPGDEGVYRMR